MGLTGFKTTIYPQSSFAEVKAVNGTISLSTSNYQIQGEMDVLKNSPGGSSGAATMTFITTANTPIGMDVIRYANQNNLKVYQMTAFQETDDNSIHLSPPMSLALPNTGNERIDLTPAIKVVNSFFGFSLNPHWIRPANPLKTDNEELQ